MSKHKFNAGQLIKIISQYGIKYNVILGGLTKKGNPSSINDKGLIVSGAIAIAIRKIRINNSNAAIIFVNNTCGWIFSNEYIVVDN